MSNIEEIENLLNSISSVDEIERQINRVSRAPKLYVRKVLVQDQLSLYSDDDFKLRFRFSKSSFLLIEEMIKPRLIKFNNRGLPIHPQLQLLIALRFYCTGSFQTVCGDLNLISQSTVSGIVTRVSKYLALLSCKFIKFPPENESQQVKEKFEKLGRDNDSNVNGLYNILGAIDCTHVKIARPRGVAHPEIYKNKKGYFSLNVQLVVGPALEIYDLVVSWPGSAHRSRIFKNSKVYTRLQSGQLPGILVGDGDYAASTYMLTPIQIPQTAAEIKYNIAVIKSINVVKWTIGIMKEMFPCLQVGLRTKLSTSCNIIVACAVLYNLKLILEEVKDTDGEQFKTEDTFVRPDVQGLAFRQSIINNFFS